MGFKKIKMTLILSPILQYSNIPFVRPSLCDLALSERKGD